jgi:7-carboxy-7-deazaguanine synthase
MQLTDPGSAQNIAEQRLRITEIFASLQGESSSVGWPTAFVRLTGCPLRCGYCDTTYAFKGGEWLTIAEILRQVEAIGLRHVTVTGGEPLAQQGVLALLDLLCDLGYKVSLETSGAVDISAIDPRVVRIVDVKTPGSREVASNLWENLDQLRQGDQLKFVICDREDYLWSRRLVSDRQLAQHCEVLFSPAWGEVEASELAGWILADRLPVRFQIQLHKYLWGEQAGV